MVAWLGAGSLMRQEDSWRGRRRKRGAKEAERVMMWNGTAENVCSGWKDQRNHTSKSRDVRKWRPISGGWQEAWLHLEMTPCQPESVETMPAPWWKRKDAAEWLYTERRRKIPRSRPSDDGATLHSAHGVHFHRRMKHSNAMIIVNMVAGMDDLSLLAAPSLPTQSSLCVFLRGGGELTSI